MISSPSSTPPSAYFEDCRAAFHRAELRCGTSHYDLQIAGQLIRIYFAGTALVEETLRALAHHQFPNSSAVFQDETPVLTVYIWDGQSTGEPIPEKIWQPAFTDVGAYGEIKMFNEGAYRAVELVQQFHGVDLLNLVDIEQRIGLVYTPSPSLPYWMASFPLYLLLHLWTLGRNLQILHAGAIGIAEGGVLIVGKSGSGKSTTTLACLETTLKYAGDDYVMVSLDDQPHIHNLYNTAKLEADNLFRLPHLSRLLANPERLDSEKALIYLNEHYGKSLIDSFPLRAILVPNITGKPDTHVRPTPSFAAMAALAPSTLTQLRAGQPIILAKIKQLVNQVPCYALDLGTELAQIPRIILALLKETPS